MKETGDRHRYALVVCASRRPTEVALLPIRLSWYCPIAGTDLLHLSPCHDRAHGRARRDPAAVLRNHQIHRHRHLEARQLEAPLLDPLG